MKKVILASMVGLTLLIGTQLLAFADEAKASTNDSLAKPENLSSQVVDKGKDAAGANKPKQDQDETKEVPHFPGHAFSGR